MMRQQNGAPLKKKLPAKQSVQNIDHSVISLWHAGKIAIVIVWRHCLRPTEMKPGLLSM